MQLTLDDILIISSQTDSIKQITKIDDDPLINAIAKSIKNFQQLPKNQEYCLSFSGGKDSHVLLAIYILYLKLGNKPLNLIVKFADTHLEHHGLYQVIDCAKKHCQQLSIPFQIVSGKQSYWYVQFALGYPVPDWRIRWCTSMLKVQPMVKSKKIKSLSGRHLGESTRRDRSLKNDCGGDSCGNDLIKDRYDPLLHWRNCLVWDAIFYFDGNLLYKNCFDLLETQYKQAVDSKTGSLRMGCFHCPVVSINTLKRNQQSGLIDSDGIAIRYLLEDLRKAKRINNPRTKKKGAIYVGDRRKYWSLLNKQYLLANKWIEPKDIESIDLALKSDYAYPPLYKKEYINAEHERILK